jgi:hypothetical protein
MLLDPPYQSLRDPFWIFQLREVADTRHYFQRKAIAERLRAY